jgi:hypothetical protein
VSCQKNSYKLKADVYKELRLGGSAKFCLHAIEENIDLLPLVLQYAVLFGKLVLNLESHLHCMVMFVFLNSRRTDLDFELYQF